MRFGPPPRMTTFLRSEGRASQEAPSARYTPFPGATLTDTFQITEKGDRADTSLIPANNERIERQLAAPIQVIVGNPPYSAGQSSANDDNANLPYPTLDARITQTYAARSTATNKNSLYDSYLRAFRWATNRIGDQGIVAFVIVKASTTTTDNLTDELKTQVAQEISPIAKPRDIHIVPELPKTRSGKIMRRLLKDVAEGRELGDTSTLVDPSVFEAIRSRKG